MREQSVRGSRDILSHIIHRASQSSASDIYTHIYTHMSVALLVLAGCPRDDWLLRWRRRAALWLWGLPPPPRFAGNGDERHRKQPERHRGQSHFRAYLYHRHGLYHTMVRPRVFRLNFDRNPKWKSSTYTTRAIESILSLRSFHWVVHRAIWASRCFSFLLTAICTCTSARFCLFLLEHRYERSFRIDCSDRSLRMIASRSTSINWSSMGTDQWRAIKGECRELLPVPSMERKNSRTYLLDFFDSLRIFFLSDCWCTRWSISAAWSQPTSRIHWILGHGLRQQIILFNWSMHDILFCTNIYAFNLYNYIKRYSFVEHLLIVHLLIVHSVFRATMV